MFKRYKVLVQALCYYCTNYNEYYRLPDEPPVCQFCGMPLNKVLVHALCYDCSNFNEYYRLPDEPPVCQFCGMPLKV